MIASVYCLGLKVHFEWMMRFEMQAIQQHREEYLRVQGQPNPRLEVSEVVSKTSHRQLRHLLLHVLSRP